MYGYTMICMYSTVSQTIRGMSAVACSNEDKNEDKT